MKEKKKHKNICFQKIFYNMSYHSFIAQSYTVGKGSKRSSIHTYTYSFFDSTVPTSSRFTFFLPLETAVVVFIAGKGDTFLLFFLKA